MSKLNLHCHAPHAQRINVSFTPNVAISPSLYSGCGPLANPTLGLDPRGMPASAGCSIPVSQFAVQASMDPRAASMCRGAGGGQGYWSPAEIQQNVGATWGREMIPVHMRMEQTLGLSQHALLSALSGASQNDLTSILGRDNPGSRGLARSLHQLARQLRTNPNDVSAIGRLAKQVHFDMVPHVATNAAERKLGRQYLRQAYGVSNGGRYNGQGCIGNTVASHSPGAVNPADGRFVTNNPSQAGLQALRAAQSQVGVREATGCNDGLPAQRYAGGRKEPWCADFVSWSFRQTGHPLPGNQRRLAGVSYMETKMKQEGKFHRGTPQPGDVIFFQNRMASDRGTGRHVGIVEKVENGRVFTIEGNSGNAVRRRSYRLDAARITGYGRQ